MSRQYTSRPSGTNSGKQRVIVCYNYKGEGHMSKQCTKPKRKRDEEWFKDKIAFMANLPHYGSDNLAEAHNQDNVTNNVIHQDMQAMLISEQLNIMNQSETEITIFNPGILIHEKPVKITTRVTQDKKLAISNASLVFEDFDPPFYEPLFFKDVPKSKMLLPFSSENEEKVFKPGIYTSEKVKERQEKDKIGTKPDQIKKKREAWKSPTIVVDLVPIPSESEGIPDNMCDVPFRNNSLPLDISKDQFDDFSNSNDDSTSIDDDSFSIDDIDYVEASPPHSELINLEEVKDFHPEDGELEDDSPIPVEDGDSFLEKFETTPKLETFKFDIQEKNSGSTTIHADISLLDLECFYFKSEPDPGDLTSIIDPGIHENVSSTTNVNLPFEDDQSPLFAYVVWNFLPFLTYPVAPPYLLSFGNEDTILTPAFPSIILLCRVYLIGVELS
nr:hypothetical protein [Tanacetum cinerariifolium]